MYGDNDQQLGDFGKRISPTMNISVGKWFTPGLGLRLQYSGLQAKGFTMDPFADYVRVLSVRMARTSNALIT